MSQGSENRGKRPPFALFAWLLVFIAGLFIFIFRYDHSSGRQVEWTPYEFEQNLTKGNIVSAEIMPESDKILFIDARNYYTAVDRTLNEWSEWQMKNLNAIVWLYRGEVDKYQQLLDTYKKKLYSAAVKLKERDIWCNIRKEQSFSETLTMLEECKPEQIKKYQFDLQLASRKDKKKTESEWAEKIAMLDEAIAIAKEACWLYEKFGDGEYKDILGLCKCASIEEIEQKGWSLTPGAYVGVKPVEDDGIDFEARMAEIHNELLELQAESNELMKTISMNMKEMGL